MFEQRKGDASFLREFIMDCPEGVLTKDKVNIITIAISNIIVTTNIIIIIVTIIIIQYIHYDNYYDDHYDDFHDNYYSTIHYDNYYDNYDDQVLDMLLFILPRDNGHIIADLIFTAFDKYVDVL